MIFFALAVHNHQPVGNFQHVLEQAYRDAYSPFINLLYQYPQIRFTLHYSGILWEWFARHHPEFIKLLQIMVERKQVELMSGAFYEPIISVISDEDKRGQIRKMNDFLKQTFGIKPRGFWLAERVWEPHLPKVLAECGLEYVIVDDSHFQEVGLDGPRLYGYYLSEDNGAAIKIFPGSKPLRYLIPFKAPEETIDYLRRIHQQGHSGIIQMGDDGEKFGVWPGTHHTVYSEGWLERFFNLLEENSTWLKMTTYADYLRRNKPLGNVYLPSASYSEMMQWALPTPLRAQFEQARQIAEHNPACHPCRRFLKGGNWRNFLIKYPEANQMHKKMLYVGKKLRQLDSCRDKQLLEQAQNELWQGQCNCAYWHGVFGGLYLPHLRKAVYEHLIKAERLLDRLRCSSYPWLEGKVHDLLLNGDQIVLLSNPHLSLYFNPDKGGSLLEWDYKPAALNFANVLTRRPESYHQKIRQLAAENAPGDRQAQSIHHIQHLKDSDLERHLSYDRYQRLSLIDHFFPKGIERQRFARGDWQELGDFIETPYSFTLEKGNQEILLKMRRRGELRLGERRLPLELSKDILLTDDSNGMNIHYQLKNLSCKTIEICFGCEFNIAVAYPEGACWQSAEDTRGSLFEPASIRDCEHFRLLINHIELELSFHYDKPALIWSLPLYTVSQAENGYERIYQGQTLVFLWELSLGPAASQRLNISQDSEYFLPE